METIQLNVSEAQMKKLMKGQPSQIQHGDIGNGVDVYLGPMNMKKLEKAYNSGKGLRLSFTNAEVDMNDQLTGGKFGKFKKGFNKVKKGARKVSDNIEKVDKNLQKADNIIQKIDRGVDRFEFLKDAGIPVVSDLYGAIDAGTDQLAVASSTASKASGDINRVNKDVRGTVNNPSVGRINRTLKNAEGMAQEYRGQPEVDDELTGQGVNPYMPMTGGRVHPFKGPISGGSFRPISGGSFRPISGKGFNELKNVRTFNDESNVIKPGHNSFTPQQSDSYASGSFNFCPHCGKKV